VVLLTVAHGYRVSVSSLIILI